MTRVFFIACMLATWAVAANATRYHQYVELDSPSHPPTSPNSLSSSPSPLSECSTVIYNMASCLPFLSDGDSEKKVDSSCCSGFNSVVKGNAECICEAVRSSSNLGVNLNLTKAVTLFSACRISSPPISNCSIPPRPPGSAPVEPPAPSSGGESPSPSTDNRRNQAPSPSPQANGGAYTASIFFTVVVIGIAVSSFSIIFV